MKARGGACCRCGGERGGDAAAGRGGALRGVLLMAALLLYCCAGALLFRAVEGPSPRAADPPPPPPPSATDPPAALRARCVERLWALTEDLNILYRDNWTALAARELGDFQRALVTSLRAAPAAPPAPPDPLPWTFAGGFLYALTLITTIGPGGAPRGAGAGGKLAAALYAAGGMPLVLLYLSAAGGLLARALRRLWGRLCTPPPPPPAPAAPSPARNPFHAALNLRALAGGAGGARGAGVARCVRVPPAVPLVLLCLYVAAGGALFRYTERWSLADGCYFSFSSLATIGLGALRPGRAGGAGGEAAAAAYIVLGMALVAAAFDLLRAELRARRAPRGVPPGEGGGGDELLAVSLVS